MRHRHVVLGSVLLIAGQNARDQVETVDGVEPPCS